MHLVTIKNLTDELLVLGTEAYPPSEEVTVFDAEDLTTYARGLKIAVEELGFYRSAITEGLLELKVDGTIFSNEEMFDVLQSTLSPINYLFACGYLHTSRFYFDMATKEWVVLDPISGKHFAVKMEEK